jgi:hypothetical protein
MEQHFLTINAPADVEPWRRLLSKNTPGTLPPSIPIFLAQGSDDRVILPKVTPDYAATFCKSGSKVRMPLLTGIGHGLAGRAAAPAAIEWMNARFTGAAAPNDCAP